MLEKFKIEFWPDQSTPLLCFQKELFSKSVNLERFWQVSWFTSIFFLLQFFFFLQFLFFLTANLLVSSHLNAFFSLYSRPGGQHVQNNHFQKSTIFLVQYGKKKLNMNCRIVFHLFDITIFVILYPNFVNIHMELFLYF